LKGEYGTSVLSGDCLSANAAITGGIAVKTIIVAGLMSAALCFPVLAQDTTTPEAHTEQPDPQAPLEGANSFTEAQARERIAEKGYADVSALVKDENGVWRGKATMAGKVVEVQVDFKGNVTSK
jgi:hypothetical protein